MRIELQPAFILHQRSYRNNSLLLEALSRDFGIVALLAKGQRSAKADKRALLQAFRPVLLSWVGKSELVTLSKIEPNGGAYMLQADALFSGFYLNELLLRMLHRYDPHMAIYALYQETLSVLQTRGAMLEPILRRFECRLLRELGYGLLLGQDMNRDAIQDDAYYRYEVESGPVLSTAGTFATYQGICLRAIAVEDFSQTQTLRAAKQLLRAVLAHHLGGKPLHSRALFR